MIMKWLATKKRTRENWCVAEMRFSSAYPGEIPSQCHRRRYIDRSWGWNEALVRSRIMLRDHGQTPATRCGMACCYSHAKD